MAVADALSDGAIRPGHVDALTRAARNLDESATASLFGDDEALAEAASTRSIAQFDAFVKRKAKHLDRSDPEVARLSRCQADGVEFALLASVLHRNREERVFRRPARVATVNES